MTKSEHTTWLLIFAACLLCAAAIFALWTPRCEAGEGDLDQRIQKQELAMEHAWNAYLDAHHTRVVMQGDWFADWYQMHDWKAYGRLVKASFRAECKALLTYCDECTKIIALYDEHRRAK